MTTATTTHKFATNCPNQTLEPTEELQDPKVVFQVVATRQCSELHDTHLFYGEHEWIRVSHFEVPADTLLLVVKWRPDKVEHIELAWVAGATTAPEVAEDNEETRITFTVPPADGSSEWIISGGSPGFRLDVTVKRKV